MYRKYYSYNDMPRLVQKPQPCEHKKEEKQAGCSDEPVKECTQGEEKWKLFGKFELDDIILGIVILAILLDDSDDSPLILALAFVFLTGLI